MNIENFIDLILSNPNNIDIKYSNINGKETLVINGHEITKEEASEFNKEISDYKRLIEDLDDCLFLEVLEDIKESIDIKIFNDLLEQSSWKKSEEEVLRGMINFTKTSIKEHIQNKISDYKELLEKI